jgi:hypothetical protein
VKLALIPPAGYEGIALRSNMHLTLAQIEAGAYHDVYKAAAVRGDYVIMDNGANEGQTVGDALLMHRASYLGAKEVVVPDVIGDRGRTLLRARQFFMNMQTMSYSPHDYKFMGVAQGRSIEEVERCVEGFSRFNYITAIGIPRHLIKSTGEQTIRVNIARRTLNKYGHRFEIHLLGTSPTWMDEVLYAARRLPKGIRSVDTSAPFNYAIAGKALKLGCEPVLRPPAYFSERRNISQELLDYNIDTLMRWADGLR